MRNGSFHWGVAGIKRGSTFCAMNGLGLGMGFARFVGFLFVSISSAMALCPLTPPYSLVSTQLFSASASPSWKPPPLHNTSSQHSYQPLRFSPHWRNSTRSRNLNSPIAPPLLSSHESHDSPCSYLPTSSCPQTSTSLPCYFGQ